MQHPNALLEKLASSSLRLNRGLLVLGALVLLLLGISYLGVQRMLDEQRDTLQFHFARLMENIHEQEVFLRDISLESAKGELTPLAVLPPYMQKPLPAEGPNIYQGRGLPFSLPYSLKINPDKIAADQYPKVFALGTYLAAYYSAFWAASHYQSPQMILLNGPDIFDVTVPATGRLRGAGQMQVSTLARVMTQVDERLRLQNSSKSDHRVHWEPYPTDQTTPALLAYVDINLAGTAVTIEGSNTWVVVASLLNLSQINNIERLMQWSIYDDFTLVTPEGEVLIGALNPGQVLNEGVNFNRDGLVFKLTSTGEQHWTAIYVISLRSFLNYALWPLLCVVVLALAILGCSRAINRWYTARVILPAQSAHASIAESEAFSRAVIDTAPIGLYVMRRSDHRVLLQNQRAQQWPGDTGPLKSLLTSHTEPGQAEIDIDGRHLHVAFVPTRYQGQDAWLCALHDMTRHIEDAAALDEARQAADAANQAKSRFLATMSHEIRTPLYGVLGTLELLGLTALAPRQQDYLKTIQRSSAILFQLISDVLDVSKIEAGQMTLELQDFCPLTLTEDTLRTYSAFARAKGLQLYACIDATLPDRLRGDPQRIRQILNNLLSNAIKFTDNGRVVLRVRVLEDARVQWQISDSGVGIPLAQQPQLFDPFYQVQDTTRQTGAGLGLAICKWLCELMHGHLQVVSEPGLGSSFTLELPLEPAPGNLTHCPVFPPDAPAVYVRVHVAEQAQHIIGWLNRLGLDSRPVTADTPPSALLVDLSPLANNPNWSGPRIIATPGGFNPAQLDGTDWAVDADDVRAIAWAVYLAQHGDSANSLPSSVERPCNLNLQVLVAEDNVINGAIIQEQLEALGCSAVVATNGEQALMQWAPGRFDLILTDVNMPVMNGYQLAQALRQQDKTLPIIGITANALREEGERCLAAGMSAWLVKPLDLATLRAQLEKHCNIAFPPVVDVPLQLSPKMRELFVTTLRQDVHTTLAALDGADANRVAQHLHSIAGALGAVQAGEMATAFIELECRLTGIALTAALTLEVRQNLARLTALLDALE